MDAIVAIALAIFAGTYVLWRLARPFFSTDPPPDRDELLQIETEDYQSQG
ncbi:MAG: hypothetical protein VX293_12730 [Candidatus Latescibacterota bacterium]|nr:hypothetical protein [Candidatus Latescibacterota bacterium]